MFFTYTISLCSIYNDKNTNFKIEHMFPNICAKQSIFLRILVKHMIWNKWASRWVKFPLFVSYITIEHCTRHHSMNSINHINFTTISRKPLFTLWHYRQIGDYGRLQCPKMVQMVFLLPPLSHLCLTN